MTLTWIKTWLSGKPHFIVGGADNPYMLRWYVLPRNRRFNVYLHKFLRDDDNRALHDHPWWFVSVILRGGYVEHTVRGWITRNLGSVAFRHATHRHRVVLWRDAKGKAIPTWTLFVTGRKKRTWGFWCPQGFVPWNKFVATGDSGAVGKGCNQ